MARILRRLSCRWLLGLGLLAPACVEGDRPFVPPLLLDQSGLTDRVALLPEAASFGVPAQGRFPDQAMYSGAIIGLAGGTQLTAVLHSESMVGLALYGPRRADGLFGAPLFWTSRTAQGSAALVSPALPAGGDYLLLAAEPDHTSLSFRLEVDCLAGCGAPRCPALVCGLYCATGLAMDADGCPTCACAAGCASDAECPLGFTCREGNCQRAVQGCGCGDDPYAPVCGEDSVTYANPCELACAGVALAHEGACAEPDCAADADCPAGMACVAGTCQPACDCSAEPYAPVCGLDGRTYASACELACAGVGLSHQGSCDTCNPEVCGDGLDNDCDGYADEGCAGTCAVDADCPAGQVCQAGTCAALLPCAAGLDCPAGQSCEAGVCRPASGCQIESCNGLDDDCDGVVDEGCPACRADEDCAAGESCDVATGRCQAVCQPSTEVCDGVDNDCDGLIDEGCASTCTSDADCAAGQLCLGGMCAVPPGCTTDADCPTGLVCLANACSRPITDADLDGYSPPEDCDDADASINPGAVELCDGVDNDCDGTVDEDCPIPCSSDADCAAGQVCFNGFCAIACRTDQECPAGQSCVGGVCTP